MSTRTIETVGFCGSSQPLSQRQRQAVRYWLRHFEPVMAVHAMAVGGDEIFDAICEGFGIPRRGYPRLSNANVPATSLCQPESIHEPREALEANGEIVIDSDAVIICSLSELHVTPRDNTWYIWDIARIGRKLAIFISEDGTACCSGDPFTDDTDGVEWAWDGKNERYRFVGKRLMKPLGEIDDPRNPISNGAFYDALPREQQREILDIQHELLHSTPTFKARISDFPAKECWNEAVSRYRKHLKGRQ